MIDPVYTGWDTPPFLHRPAFIARTFSIFGPLLLLFSPPARLNSVNLPIWVFRLQRQTILRLPSRRRWALWWDSGKKYPKVSSSTRTLGSPHKLLYCRKSIMLGVIMACTIPPPPQKGFSELWFKFDNTITPFLFIMLRRPLRPLPSL